jgi:hypothetical protein
MVNSVKCGDCNSDLQLFSRSVFINVQGVVDVHDEIFCFHLIAERRLLGIRVSGYLPLGWE